MVKQNGRDLRTFGNSQLQTRRLRPCEALKASSSAQQVSSHQASASVMNCCKLPQSTVGIKKLRTRSRASNCKTCNI